MTKNFETFDTGRGSNAHKEYLRKEIKNNLCLIRLRKMTLTKLNDRAEEALEQYKTNPSDELKEELRIIGELLKEIISKSKK